MSVDNNKRHQKSSCSYNRNMQTKNVKMGYYSIISINSSSSKDKTNKINMSKGNDGTPKVAVVMMRYR